MSVFVGGTGSANQLDDYEEGSWTPSIRSSNGGAADVTYNVAVGRYKKIGSFVHCSFDLTWTGFTNMNGAIIISGLPFTNRGDNSTRGYGAPQFRDLSGLHSDIRVNGNSSWLYPDTNQVYLMAFNSSGTEYYVTANTNGRITGEIIEYTEV